MSRKMASEDVDPRKSRLDALICEIFETLNKIFETRESFNQSVSQGYYHLAKARYSMGVNSVTSLQYNLKEDSRAFYKILVDDKGDINKKDVTLQIVDNLDCQKDNDLANSIEMTQLSLHEEDVSDNSHEDKSNLRLRKQKKDTDFQEDEKDKKQLQEMASSRKSCDPLLWFGVLVPRSLRTSQQNFRNSLNLSCQLTQLQFHLKKLQTSYKNALAKMESSAAVSEVHAS